MKIRTALTGAVVVGLLAATGLAQPISYTGTPVAQNFDTLPATGTLLTWTNGTTLPGWYAFQRAVTTTTNNTGTRDPAPWQPLGVPPAGTQTFFNASTGSGTSGSLYSFGLDGNTARTLGSIGSGTSGDLSYGMVLVNDTGATQSQFRLQYTGRQWRNGGNATQQKLVFDYKIADSFDATQMAGSLENSGSGAGWTEVPALDFTGPIASTTAGALVGTDPANSVAIDFTVTGITWNAGQVLYLRWWDDNSPGNDHGLGLDDMTFSTVPIGPAALAMSATALPAIVEQIGTPITYTINAANTGASPLIGGSITCPFPAGVSFVSCSIAGATFNSQTLTIPLPTIPASTTLPAITLVMNPVVAFPPPAATQLNATFTGMPGTIVSSVSTPVVNNADVGLTASVDPACEAPVGTNVTYTINAANNGPTNGTGVTVTATLADNTSYVSSSATQGSVAQNGQQVTWTVGSLGAGAGTQTLTLVAAVNSAGGSAVPFVATSASYDLTTANNTVTLTTNAPSTGAAKLAYLSSVANAPTSSIAVPSGIGPLAANFGTAGGGNGFNTFAFGRPFRSPDGSRWVMVADTNLAATENTVLMTAQGTGTPTIIARENTDIIDPVANDAMGTLPTPADPVFERMLAINNAGQVAFAGQTNNTDTTKRRVVVKATPGATVNDPYAFSVVARQSNPADTIGAGLLYGTTMTVAGGGIGTSGDVAFYAITTTGIQAMLKGNGSTLVSRSGQAAFAPAGQAAGRTDTWASYQNNSTSTFQSRGFSITPDGNTWMIEGSLNNPNASANEVVVLNTAAAPNTVILQEGSVIPGSGFTQPISSGATTFINDQVEPDGSWMVMGLNAPVPPSTASQAWIVRNGLVVAKTGDPITTGSGETWSNAVLGNTFFTATGSGSDYVIGGLTSRTDRTTDSVLVHNGTTVLLREGDPVNVGTTDSPIIYWVGPILRDNRSFISGDRKLFTVVDLRNSQWPCAQSTTNNVGQAVLVIDLPAGSLACNVADICGIGGPPSVPDGLLTGDDFNAFINAFAASDPLADICGIGGPPALPDGLITGDDFNAFINAFASGCP